MVVRYPGSRRVPRGKLSVTIESADHDPFRIQFDVEPGERQYVINLDRVWFWKLLAKSSPHVAVEDDAAEETVEYLREKRPVLY
jgi:hypothetical protein